MAFKGQYSLRLLCSKVIFFGLCFGVIRNYIHPEWLLPITEGMEWAYVGGWGLVGLGVICLYFMLLYGKENIVEDPVGWIKSDRLYVGILAFIEIVMLASFFVVIQLVLLCI